MTIGKEAAKALHKHWEPGPGDPEHGYLDGALIKLSEVEDTIPVHRWPDVVVVRDGEKMRPWRGLWGF